VSAEYRQRVCMHEAGHFLVAYLMGVLPKGYTLSAVDALRRYGALNIQAGTVFCDREFQSEVRKSLSLPGGVPHGRAAQGLHAAACSRARCANLFHFLVAYLMGVLPKGYTLPRVPERGAQISFATRPIRKPPPRRVVRWRGVRGQTHLVGLEVPALDHLGQHTHENIYGCTTSPITCSKRP
jgi:hypothetical protein